MSLTLNDLISKNILENHSVLSGKQSMERDIKSVSILETPDFERYIIEDSVILTTFYPIKNELSLAESLLHTLSQRQTAGIIIKLHRYIDELPETFVSLAQELSIPVIVLHYDANLSLLFNNILSEIQRSEYSNLSLEQSYARVFQTIYENPTTETLMLAVNEINNFELLIENLDTDSISYSSKDVFDYYKKNRHTTALIQRNNQDVYYLENVIYEDKPIYKMVFLARQDQRHIIHNTIEVFRLLVIVIYQSKQEQLRKQQEFLMNFVSNPNSITPTTLSSFAKDFQWTPQFPLLIVLISVKSGESNIYVRLIEYVRSIIVTKWNKRNDEFRYATLDDQLFFIINTGENFDPLPQVHTLIEFIDKAYSQDSLKIAYSKPIYNQKDIALTYREMSYAMQNLRNSAINKKVFNEEDLLLFNMLRHANNNEIQRLIKDVFQPLIPLDSPENKTLLETLYVYIESKFNIKDTAERLFVHYNTVRYRLDRLEAMRLLPTSGENYFKLHLALYLFFTLTPL